MQKIYKDLDINNNNNNGIYNVNRNTEVAIKNGQHRQHWPQNTQRTQRKQ